MSTQATPRFYHPELDALRFGAFLAVFVAHAIPSAPEKYTAVGIPESLAGMIVATVHSGVFGVTLFFLLSSYLITALLLREHEASGRLDLLAFYIRRSLRIWPLYFFFLLLCFWVLPALGWPSLRTVHKLGFSFFVGNWTMVFFGPPWGSPATPLWSVSVEEQFYLLWPLALAFFGVGRLRTMAVALLVVGTLTRLTLAPFGLSNSAFWANTLVELDPIALGALLALVFRNGLPVFSTMKRLLLFGVGGVIPPIVFSQFGQTGWGAATTFPLVAAATALIFMAVVSGPPPVWLRKGPLIYLGKISYGLYVYHILMLQLAEKLWPDSRIGVILGAFAGTIAVAAISYQVLERPFLLLKERFTHIVSRPA